MSSTPAKSSTSLLQQLDYSVLQQCMHCGLCLPTCPTYDATKRETSSPRGRIALMRAIADGRLPVDSPEFAGEMDFCLGCLACETACPAGVHYGEMLEAGRAEAQPGWRQWWLLRALFRWPWQLRVAARTLRLDQRLGLSRALLPLLPRRFRELHTLQPKVCDRFSFDEIAATEQPPGTSRYCVGMLTGCVQDVAYAQVNRDTVDVLLANDCEVVTPRSQGCCGSLMGHTGDLGLARQSARRNLAAFDLDRLDAIITNAAGCGGFLKRYRHLLPDDPRAAVWDAKVQDIHEWLARTGLRPPPGSLAVQRVTYHDACHLAHGQKITAQPRDLLRTIPGLELVDLPESAWCCGSAGIYNITQPAMSAALLERKLNHIAATGVTIVATANPGCIGQISAGARQRGLALEVIHPITLLARAYRAG